jgi:hypothetical protein
MDAQRLGLWALQPPSRRAKCPKGLDLSAARKGTTIARAAIETPRFSGIVSILHADRNLRRSVLTLDFKFPCPGTNEPRWKEYGENSAYAGSNQGKIYKEALGGEALLISPRGGMTP